MEGEEEKKRTSEVQRRLRLSRFLLRELDVVWEKNNHAMNPRP